jgi:hypothetical protein
MKRQVQPKSDDEIIRSYPIGGKVDGWFFRMEERSPALWIVEGIDRYGRHVHRQGYDPDQLLQQCIADAQNINNQLRAR